MTIRTLVVGNRWAMNVVKALRLGVFLPLVAWRWMNNRRGGSDPRRRTWFVDLGAYDGDSALKAMEWYPGAYGFVLFEPGIEQFNILQRRFAGNLRVKLNRAAAGTENRTGAPLYHGTRFGHAGDSLQAAKSNVSPHAAERVEIIDFSDYLRSAFSAEDDIILKVDVEGTEYGILEKLIADGTIGRVRKMYCEWHGDRVAVPASQHSGLVRKLNSLGFDLVGVNRFDEFHQQHNNGTYWSLGVRR